MKFAKSARLAAAVGGVLAASLAFGGTYTFNPDPVDLEGLDHYFAYEWGISMKIPQGETITGATLTFKNIYNWTAEENVLNVRMLDNPLLGVNSYYDDQATGDYFEGQGKLIGKWTDTQGGNPRNFNLVYDLKGLGLLSAFNTYAKDGTVGFAFDPDCHYWNEGIELKVTTSKPVPEPCSMTLLGLAAAGAWLKKKRLLKH